MVLMVNLSSSLAILLISTPWLIGAASGILVSSYTRRDYLFILCGLFGAASYLIFGNLIWFADQYGVSLFDIGMLVPILCIALLVACCGGYRHLKLRCRPDENQASLKHALYAFHPFALLVLLIASTSYIALNAPVQGWDVTDHWAGMAKSFIYHTLSLWEAPFEVRYLHPPTWSYLIAHAHWVAEEIVGLSFNPFWIAPLMLMSISLACTVWGWSRLCGGTIFESVSLTYFALSIPIVEVHSKVVGYADLPLGIAYALSAVALALSVSGYGLKFFVISLVLAVLVLSLKNTGFIYSLSLFGMLLLVALPRIFKITSRGFLVVLLTFLVLPFLLVLVIPNFIIEIFGFNLGYSLDANSIYVGGRALVMRYTSAYELGLNLITAYVINQSYSVLLAAAVLASLYLLHRGRNWTFEKKSAAILFAASTWAFLVNAASQFTQYGFVHATPGSDTGLSRFSMTIFLPLIFLLIAALSLLKEERQRAG